MTETTSDTASNNESVPVTPEVVGNAQPAEDEAVVANAQPAQESDEDAKRVEAARQRAEDSADDARAQYEADQKFHAENPNVPVVREANPDVGGESFL